MKRKNKIISITIALILTMGVSEKSLALNSISFGLAASDVSSISGNVSIDAGDIATVGEVIYETMLPSPGGLFYQHSAWVSGATGTYIPITMPSYTLYADLTTLQSCPKTWTWDPAANACVSSSTPEFAVRIIYIAGGREFIYGNATEGAVNTGVIVPGGDVYPKAFTAPAFIVSGTDSVFPGEFKIQVVATTPTPSAGSYQLHLNKVTLPYFGPGENIKITADNIQWLDRDTLSIMPPPISTNIGPPIIYGANPGVSYFLKNAGDYSGIITVNVTTTTCSAILDNIDVDLGVNSTSLSSSPLVPFNIGFTCSDPSLILKPEMTFTAEEGTGGSADLILNRLVSSDAATGAGVELLDKNGVQIPLNEPYAYPDTIDLGSLGGEGQLEFNARLVALPGKTPTAGKYESVATLAVDYP